MKIDESEVLAPCMLNSLSEQEKHTNMYLYYYKKGYIVI